MISEEEFLAQAKEALLSDSKIIKHKAWEEVKLGRIFKQSSCMDISNKRGWIRHSLYEAYLGKVDKFTDRMDRYLGCYRGIDKRLIFVGDGARWIWKWVDQHYPFATQILDLSLIHISEPTRPY